MPESFVQSSILTRLCYEHGVRKAVLSPGSRNAPLALAFFRHDKIKTISVLDERAAGFCALGMAQSTQQPVALICTSGTAAQNYAPAVTEAFYSNVPLVVLTADRPPEWIDQQDGQAIHQENLYRNHIRYQAVLPTDPNHPDEKWHVQRLINEALNAARFPIPGPVHLNVPFREPFYPDGSETSDLGNISITKEIPGKRQLNAAEWTEITGILNRTQKVIFLAGQDEPKPGFQELLEKVSTRYNFPVVADHTANVGSFKNRIWAQDLMAFHPERMKALQPELVIRWGRSVLSRQWKEFLRQIPDLKIWHIQSDGNVADTFQAVDRIIRTDPESFFRNLADSREIHERKPDFCENWLSLQQEMEMAATHVIDHDGFEFSEAKIVRDVLANMPSESNLHLGNSLPVRWANLFPLTQPNINVYSNRGTSGIDGTVSTVVGHALADNKLQVLIVGDLAFQYDHSLIHELELPDNLRILVLNNQGGGIFGVISGPVRQPDFEPVFRTPRSRSIFDLVKNDSIQPMRTKKPEEFEIHLKQFLDPASGPVIWEIMTDWKVNQQFFKEIKLRDKS